MIKQFKVGFCKGRYLLSRIIMRLTNSNVSHTYIVLNLNNQEFIYEASIFGVRLISRELFEKDHEIIKELTTQEMSTADFIELKSWLLGKLGVNYGFKTLVGFTIFLLGRLTGFGWKNPWKDGDSTFICSELVARALHLESAEDYTPQELLDFLERTSWEE